MSPTMATFKPFKVPLCSRIVSKSRNDWLGCSCIPSPALMTGQFTNSEIREGAPEQLCLTTRISGLIASRFLAVSIRLSPLTTLLPAPEILITSALNLFPAISNEVRVRVLGSKNRFIMVLPLRVGTFLIARVEISLKESAVSRIVSISFASRSFVVIIFCWLRAAVSVILQAPV